MHFIASTVRDLVPGDLVDERQIHVLSGFRLGLVFETTGAACARLEDPVEP
jgi:hypothetical protein